VVLTVLNSFSRQSFLVSTNVTSALEVFKNYLRYINSRFTLLYLLYQFVCERSCADQHCVRGCDHGADVAGHNNDCSCLVTVSVTDDIDCLKRDGKAHRRHLRRGSPQLCNQADNNQREFRVLTIPRCAGSHRRW